MSAAEVGRVAVGNNYFYPIKENHPVPILELTEQDKRYIIYALAEYMVRNNIVSLEDIPDSVYKDMVAGNAIQDDDGNIINANPDYDYYKAEFNKAGSITQDEFRQLIAKYPELYNSLIEKIDRTRFVNEAKDFGLQIAGGVSGVAISFGQIGEPFLKPLETVEALYDFVQTEDKLLAIQMAVAMDLQNRQDLLEMHNRNNDTFGTALETSRNTADALLVLTSIHKAPKEIVTLIPTLKNAGSVIFKGVKYTYSEGKIVAQKIPSPNANVNTNVPASQNLPDVYGDGDLGNVLDGNPNAPADRIIATEKSNHTKELKDLGVEKIGQLPHYDDKHGTYTSLQDQYDRAMTGTNKTLSEKGYPPGRPVNASKFFNSTDMQYAIQQAEKMYAENPSKYTDSKGKISIDTTFDRPIGEGFMGANKTNTRLGIAGEYRWSNTATVSVDPRTGKVYTAFPNMDKGYKQDNEMFKFVK